MTDDIVARLRVWSTWLDERCPDTEVRNDLREAADEIERLRQLVTKTDELRVDRSEIVKTANLLRNGTHRVYMVRANDYSRGTVMPVRIATAKTLSAMIERCAEDCYGKDAKQVGTGSWDLSVIVTVGELEVQSE